MYISPKASRIRQREAQRARENRREIRRALATGQITRRDLMKWGIITTTGALALKNGLSPFARSAFADDIPTGTPRSPLFGAQKFTQEMPRLDVQTPLPLTPNANNEAVFPVGLGHANAKEFSYHNDFNNYVDPVTNQPVPVEENPFRNPLTDRGPMEGRPWGEFFAHQRWNEFFPKVGYVMSWGQIEPGSKFHPDMPDQAPNSVWTFGPGKFAQGRFAPPLIKGRYGEPMLARIYNNTSIEREAEGIDFGRNETQLHFHNAHNAAESDGATAAHHFPGTFYDYLWGTALARRDIINTDASDSRAAGPDDGAGIVKVAGDWRELQGTMWMHDHRFYFTAENVYKGNMGMVNYYSGRDRGHEMITNGGNLRLPSGKFLGWGNVDFDVNLILHDGATDQEGQYFYDIFAVDGFLGDLPLVNFAYAPYFNVLPRKYRFRILNACMSRFLKMVLSYNGAKVPFKFIANDGNFVVNPITINELDQQGTGERYDIVVDFSMFPIGSKIKFVNTLRTRDDGRGPKEEVSLAEALGGDPEDPVIGPMMEFRVVPAVPSVDLPGYMLTQLNSCGPNDKSQVPAVLTEQIPIVAPVRTRVIEYGRSGGGDSRDPVTGECTPDCPEFAIFPWSIKIDGEDAHTFNANRISLLIPAPGEVEHWTLVNGGGGWDHPIHLHFEEGITISRGDMSTGTHQPSSIPATEEFVRKDVWRLRESGSVKFQVQFGEFGGSYVNHCHNTVHEDFAMLLRLQILAGAGAQTVVTPTPNATPDGVFFTTPEILPEGDPRTHGA